MAYERLSEKKIIATNLTSFIKSQMLLITQARTRRNLEDEAQFNQAVLEDNLSLDQQLVWRKDQFKRVDVGDKAEKRRVRGEISTLKDLIEQKKFSDKYYDQVIKLNAGMQSIDATLNWLDDKLKNTTDLNIQKTIKDNISQLTTLRYTQRKTALESQTNFANKDKTPEVVQKQIERVNTERAKALKAGNEDYTALLDLQLQSLNKTASESQISRTLLDFSVATMTGQSATGLLNQFNTQIQNADVDGPVTIGGTKYDSAKQFWELKQSDYLNDRSANGFFPRYQSELKEKVNYKASRGILTNASLTDVKNYYDVLKDRPELADYADRIATDQQASLQSSADVRAANIINEFATNLDSKKALSDLAYLQDTFSVDQTLNYQKVVSSAAKEKQAQIDQILNTMGSLMKANPGISNQAALEQAISSGAGAVYSPQELATNKASDIITGMGEKATAQQFGQDSSGATVPNKPEFAKPDLKEGELVKLPNSNTVYKVENGKLRGFVGAWDEAKFKQATGQGFGSVKTVQNLSGIPQGDVIRPADIQTIPTPDSKYKEGELIKVANSSTVYKVENNKLRPFTGAWDEAKFKQATGQGFGSVKTVDSINGLATGKEIKYQ